MFQNCKHFRLARPASPRLTKTCYHPAMILGLQQRTHDDTRVPELRQGKSLTLRDLARIVQVTFTYLSKIENQKLSFGEFPSSDLIVELARVLEGDPDELLLLAEKVPATIRQRVLQRPDAFRKLAILNDQRLDDVLEYLDKTSN
jgi:transcriptional regulator with XRE-family HTH domain